MCDYFFYMVLENIQWNAAPGFQNKKKKPLEN